MQRIVLGLALLSLLSIGSAPALAQKGKKPKAALKKIVDTTLKAHGGREKLKSVGGFIMTLEGTIYETPSKLIGYKNKFMMATNGNTRSEVVLKIGDKTKTALFNANQKGVWIKSGDGPAKQLSKAYWKEEMAEGSALWEGFLLRSLADGKGKLSSLGIVKVKGPLSAQARDCYGILVERKGAGPVRLYVEKSSNKVVKMLYTKKPLPDPWMSGPKDNKGKGKKDKKKPKLVTYEFFFEGFEAEEGIQIPRKLVVQRDGAFAGEFRVTRFAIENKFAQDTFDAPK